MKLKVKFLIPVLGIILVGLLSITTLGYVSAKKALEQSVHTQLTVLTEATSEVLGKFIRDNRNLLHYWASDPLYTQLAETQDRFSAQAVNDKFSRIITTFPSIENIFLTLPDGTIMASALNGVAGKVNIADRPYFKETLKGHPFTSQVLKSKVTGAPIYVESFPLMKNNTVVGVLSLPMKMNAVTDLFIDPIKVGETGYAFVMEQNGPVIAYPDKSKILSLNGHMFDFSEDILRQKSGLITYHFQGEEKISVFKQEALSGWITVINAPTKEVLAGAVTLRNRLILMATLTMVMIWLVVRSLTQFIVVKRINNITVGMKDISEGEGDLTKRLRIQSEDEIGELAEWFNSFVEKLQQLISEITQKTRMIDTASTTLSGITRQMNEASEEMSQKALSVTSSSGDLNTHMNLKMG
ncbi:methyl-accepting chemotaxis protein [Desulfoluna sp.]|uniref:PDC sensor domain-containing protein n=1 Tax=Desulfoluna sp. TaxID=2045199 RepID=UPI002608E4CD|nr:methyl-accepting chemotaxis protein [Desulfoluna sp.]